MQDPVCLIGLDQPEIQSIQKCLDLPIMAHETLPRIILKDDTLFVQVPNTLWFAPVSKVVFHGIFEDDLDFIAALALWSGPCFPDPQAMMDCRLKLPCLVKALQHTRFGDLQRGYLSPGAEFQASNTYVAKWGNWHCGENKECFTGSWKAQYPSIIEEFLTGTSIRITIIGDHHWQVQMEGTDWRKSIHDQRSKIVPADPELVQDTIQVGRALGLKVLANDYMITEKGSKYLLEVNHIPNVTHFQEMWQAYQNYIIQWILTAPVKPGTRNQSKK